MFSSPSIGRGLLFGLDPDHYVCCSKPLLLKKVTLFKKNRIVPIKYISMWPKIVRSSSFG